MSNILVSGLINLETTLRVEGFPIEYSPVHYPFFGVKSTISGVGFNVAKALSTLGDNVKLLSMVGNDLPGKLAFQAVEALKISPIYLTTQLDQTPQSVILFDYEGNRQIYVDLKNIQDQKYPPELVDQALVGCELAVLCNINFSRPWLKEARSRNVLIATDVHAISDLEDPYNQDFMANADILFMSHENLPVEPGVWAQQVINRFRVEILVIGLGAGGALLAMKQDRCIEHIPPANIRPLVNTIGAGDALFSCFVHEYLQTKDPYYAIHRAVLFASYKIGDSGAADGFLDSSQLDQLSRKI